MLRTPLCELELHSETNYEAIISENSTTITQTFSSCENTSSLNDQNSSFFSKPYKENAGFITIPLKMSDSYKPLRGHDVTPEKPYKSPLIEKSIKKTASIKKPQGSLNKKGNRRMINSRIRRKMDKTESGFENPPKKLTLDLNLFHSPKVRKDLEGYNMEIEEAQPEVVKQHLREISLGMQLSNNQSINPLNSDSQQKNDFSQSKISICCLNHLDPAIRTLNFSGIKVNLGVNYPLTFKSGQKTLKFIV